MTQEEILAAITSARILHFDPNAKHIVALPAKYSDDYYRRIRDALQNLGMTFCLIGLHNVEDIRVIELANQINPVLVENMKKELDELKRDRNRLDKLADLKVLEAFGNQNKDIHERACDLASKAELIDAVDMKNFYREALREMVDEL